MDGPGEQFIRFKRDRFSARLPARYLFCRSHFWLAEAEPGLWHVGLTNFATRMLGEIVEFDFEAKPGAAVAPGAVVGWIEGFKAISDLYCAAAGEFIGGNPEAMADAALVCAEPYGRGWLYAVRGQPDPEAVDVQGYVEHLGLTIDKMQGKELPPDDAAKAGEEEKDC